MNNLPPDPLLQGIINNEELEKFRLASLQQGLTVVRARRRRKRAITFAMTASALMVLLSLVFFKQIIEPTSPHTTPLASSTVPKSSPIQIITDDELLALFPDQSVALIGKPGAQQLVLLNHPPRPPHP